MNRVQCLEFWYAALRARVGVRIKTNNATLLLQHLYIVRRETKDPELQALSLARNPNNKNEEVWIVHQAVKLQVAEEDQDNGQA